jgi:hypothetical protein
MNYDHYTNVRFTEDYHLFLFESAGPKGNLKKVVAYSELKDFPNIYNLGLGTIKIDDNGNEYIDGNEISNNGDRNKLLSTVAITAFTFTDRYPDKKIYFKGADEVRTRLYQMAINYAYEDLSKKFIILGDLSERAGIFNLQAFERNKNYTGFVFAKRQL